MIFASYIFAGIVTAFVLLYLCKKYAEVDETTAMIILVSSLTAWPFFVFAAALYAVSALLLWVVK